MAAPPASKSITLEQVPDEHRRALQPVLQQLNPFMTAVGAGLNKSLTFTDNFVSQIQDLTFTAADDWTTIGPGSLLNSFTLYDSANFPVRYRKTPDGYAEGVGLVVVPAGPPANFTGIYSLPPLLAPPLEQIIETSSNDAFNVVSITSGVAPVVRIRATAVTATNWFKVAYRFLCADRTPLWSAPFPLSFTSKLPVSAKGLLVLAATVTDPNNKGIDDPKTNVGPLWVDWMETSQGSQRTIKVRGVAGTVPGKSYRLRLLVVGG